MNIQKFVPLLVVSAAAVASNANAVVVFSENFDNLITPPVVLDTVLPPGGFLAVNGTGVAGNFGNGWTLTGGVDFIRESAPGSHTFGAINNISIDMLGTPGPGSLSHTFNAVAGTTYLLAWDYFRNGNGSPLKVTIGNIAGQFGAPLGIETGQLQWVAGTTGLQTFSFTGLLNGQAFAGATIDNVVLTAVPEPGPMALMLMGLGVVGFLARKRLNVG